MARGQILKPVGPCRRHPARPLVNADGKVEFLGFGPEDVVISMPQHAIVIRVRAQKTAPHPQFIPSVAHFFDSQLDGLHG